MLALFLSPFLLACDAPVPAPELKSYPVPAGYAEELSHNLNTALSGTIAGSRAVEGPNDTVIVVAPPQVQAGVAELIAGIQAQKLPEKVGQNIAIRYWVVRGTPSEEMERATSLMPVSPVLDVLIQQDGPQSFSMVAAPVLQTADGTLGSLAKDRMNIRQMAQLSEEEQVLADLVIEFSGEDGEYFEADARLRLGPDQSAVLARSVDNDGNIYVIVQPSVL